MMLKYMLYNNVGDYVNHVFLMITQSFHRFDAFIDGTCVIIMPRQED